MELSKEGWNDNLRKIRPAVKNIFYKGDIDVLLNDSPKLAIVGSRKMSEYGARVIDRWIPELVSRGVVIVSGFMYGVDQMAHRICLDCGGKTIAVLGWGIEDELSSLDKKLYDKILEVDSLILSEWKEMRGSRWTFPQRNRIVAGVSDAILVVEGAEKSGSMITARYANRYGKPLLAVPGQVTSTLAGGTNSLIKKGNAQMVTSVGEIFDAMGLSAGQMRISINENKELEVILGLLAENDMGVDELLFRSSMGLPELMQKLMELSLNGEVVERGGKFGMRV